MKKGFTLIELLVVIAIIGILSGLIVISMNGSINSANDAKRKTDIDTMRKGVIIYGTLNRMVYPIQPTQCNIGPLIGTPNRCTTLADNLSELLPNLPVDPVSGYYTYVSTNGSDFTVGSTLFNSNTYTYTASTGFSTLVPPSPLTDIDGNIYGTVVIGTQTWMTSNLMTTRYKDGSAITRGPVGATWDGTDHGYYAYPPAVGNGAEETLVNIQSNKLGFVYQWSTVNSGKLCPSGWHIPTHDEWTTLERSVCTSGTCATDFPYNTSTTGWRGTNEGGRLKESGTTHWTSPNTGATNSSGFTVVGTGSRGTDGSFYYRSELTYLWSSTVSTTSAWYRYLISSYTTVSRSATSQASGFSVRCLKD